MPHKTLKKRSEKTPKTTRDSKSKIIVILGPTATGKSDLGVLLAKKFNGEIISVDSRQIYKGMDIGTGKITKKEMGSVPHHLLDIVKPQTSFNVTKFKTLADRKISVILKNNKLPFLVGGTGFWIDAVALNQTFTDAPPNPELRKNLNNKSAAELFITLNKLDPERAKKIDRNNKVRLIRAIEITTHTKQSSTLIEQPEPIYQTLYIGLDLPDKVLFKKISDRLNKRLKQGMIKEVERLHQQGVSWKRLEELGLEYRFIAEYLQKQMTREEMEQQLLQAIKKYAKRQRTWFKRNKNIIWLDPSKKSSAKNAETILKKFLKQN